MGDPRAWITVSKPDFRVYHHKKAVDSFDFKVGARVRCTYNCYETDADTGERKLVVPNGAVGTILSYETEPGEPDLVASVNIKWDQVSRTIDAFERTHKPAWMERLQRKRYDHPEFGELPLKAVRLQLPLEICYAKTVHSAQGTSIFAPTDVCVNRNRAPPPRPLPGQPAGPKTFPPIHGLIYTAVSRFASEQLIRHMPTPGAPQRICRPDDVYCDAAVTAFYNQHGNTTPARGCAPRWARCRCERVNTRPPG